MSDGGAIFHQALLDDGWTDVYELTGETMPEIDRVVASWYTSTHPASHFRSRLLVARATDTGRVGLTDRELVERTTGGVTQKRVLGSHDELMETLAVRFGIELPPSTRLASEGLQWGPQAL